MIYYTDEARETALTKIAELQKKLGSLKPTDGFDLDDINYTGYYLNCLSYALKDESKEAKKRIAEYANAINEGNIFLVTFDSVKECGDHATFKAKRYFLATSARKAKEKANAYLMKQLNNGEWLSGYIFLVENVPSIKNSSFLVIE